MGPVGMHPSAQLRARLKLWEFGPLVGAAFPAYDVHIPAPFSNPRNLLTIKVSESFGKLGTTRTILMLLVLSAPASNRDWKTAEFANAG